MSTETMKNETSERHAGHVHRDWPYRRPAIKRYGFALLLVALACVLRFVVYGDFNTRLTFTFFVPAAMAAAWYGGMGPGMVATASGLLAGMYFVLAPRGDLDLGQRALVAMAVYAITTAFCVILCEHLHQLVRKLEHVLEHERHASAALPVGGAGFFDHGSPFRRPALPRYGMALAVVASAFALRYWLIGADSDRFPFLFFVPAAMIATWYGGMAPGMLAALLGLMLGDYFFLSEHAGMGPVRETERLAIGVYAATTTLCVMLIENLHVRVQRTEHAIAHARHNHQHHHHVPGSAADASRS